MEGVVRIGKSYFVGNKLGRLVNALTSAEGKLLAWFPRRPGTGVTVEEHQTGRAYLSIVRHGLNRLDKKSIIAEDDGYQSVRRLVEPALEFVRARTRGLGQGRRVEVLKQLEKLLGQQREKSRAAEYRGRLLCEISEAVANQRFCVFNTLTCDNFWLNRVFCKGSNLFRMEVARLKKAVKDAAGREESYFSYFCIPEEGGETGRMHFHVVWIMSHLPKGCVDMNPMAGGVRREVDALRRFWRYGKSSPIAVRWAGDPYGLKVGWRWPSRRVVRNGEEVLEPVASSGSRLASYLVKYLIKQKGERWTKKAWRTKMSRGFGTQKIRRTVEAVETKVLVALVAWTRSKEFSQVRLVRRIARLELGNRLTKEALKATGGHQIVTKFLGTVPKQETLYTRLSQLVLTKQDFTRRNVGSWIWVPDSKAIFRAREVLVGLREYYEKPHGVAGAILGRG